tara:strand:- start:4913 stop:5665 length:753 start_codon:yes stop_codon:yes gene_type:complete
MIKISIIVATFNSSSTICDCIESIITQNYSNIEIIVIDGKSNDNTIELLNRNYKNFSIKIISEPDKGIYDALNKGIILSEGDVVGFVHSDDILKSNEIIAQIADNFNNKNIDGVYGDLQYVNKKDSKIIIRNWISCDFNFNLLAKGWMPPHPTLFLKKEVYKKHGLFDLKYSISADYDFMLRVFKDTDLTFYYMPKVITLMRVGGVSNRNLKNLFVKTKEDYNVIKNNNIGNLLTLFLKNFSKISQFFNV